MTSTRFFGLLVVALLLGGACSNGNGNGQKDPDGKAPPADSANGDASGETTLLCTPGEVRCGEAAMIERCDESGMAFSPDSECLDGNPCTDDMCELGICTFPPAAKCDDKDPCTKDVCYPFSGECAVEPALGTPGCCSGDQDCSDGLDFTSDLCDVANGACVNTVDEPHAEFLFKFATKGAGAGELTSPKGIAVMDDGRILVADSGNNRVVIFAGTGEHLGDILVAGEKPLKAPGCVYQAPDGRVFICDTGNDRLIVLDANAEFDKEWPPADADAKMFHSPTDIVAGPEGNFYVTDGPGGEFDTGNRIIKMKSTLQVLKEQGKPGIGNGNFDKPSGIGISSAGSLFITDQGNDRVQVLGTDLEFAAKFGGVIEATEEGQEDIPAIFKSPSDIVVAPDDTLIIVDSGHQQVLVFKGCEPDCTGKLCGDDGCGLPCGECPSFAECNASNQCDGFVGEAGDGCVSKLDTGEMGCGGCPCENCVCTGEGALDPSLFFQGADSDPYCCETEWDDVCVFECMMVCGFSCPIPDDVEWPVHDPTFTPTGGWSDTDGTNKFTAPLKLDMDKNDVVYVLDTVKAEILLFKLHY